MRSSWPIRSLSSVVYTPYMNAPISASRSPHMTEPLGLGFAAEWRVSETDTSATPLMLRGRDAAIDRRAFSVTPHLLGRWRASCGT